MDSDYILCWVLLLRIGPKKVELFPEIGRVKIFLSFTPPRKQKNKTKTKQEVKKKQKKLKKKKNTCGKSNGI